MAAASRQPLEPRIRERVNHAAGRDLTWALRDRKWIECRRPLDRPCTTFLIRRAARRRRVPCRVSLGVTFPLIFFVSPATSFALLLI